MKRDDFVVAFLLGLLIGFFGGYEVAHGATTIIAPPDAHRPYQGWIDKAKVPTPDTTLSVIEDATPCEGANACTIPEEGTIWMGDFGRQTFYHEVGHNFDYLMPEWARLRYVTILGRAPQPWRQSELSFDSPSELFAESYALCAFRPKLPPHGIVRGQEPVGGWRVHNRTCRMLAKL